MALYEGPSDKQTVIFDIGHAYTKLGFGGEVSPRFIIKSEVRHQETGQTENIFNYKNEDDLYDTLVEFTHALFFRYLNANPKDRKVTIVESLLCPTVIRETLARVMFRHFEVGFLLFVPSHLVAVGTLGSSTALVVDIGYQEAVAVPVYQGVVVLQALQAQPLAAEAIHSNMRSLMKESGNSDLVAIEPTLTDSTIEDIKVRTCFVTTLERSQMLKTEKLASPPDVVYRIDGSSMFTIPGFIRERTCEILFEEDADQVSLSTMVLDSILKCPVDMRKSLAENILVIGGTAELPGLKARLSSELKCLIQTPKYSSKTAIKLFKFHRPPAKDNYVGWLGGSLYGAADIFTIRAVSRESYQRDNGIPDWANLFYNRRDSDVISV